MGHFHQQKLFMKHLLVMQKTKIGSCILIQPVHWFPRQNTNFAGKAPNSSIRSFTHTR